MQRMDLKQWRPAVAWFLPAASPWPWQSSSVSCRVIAGASSASSSCLLPLLLLLLTAVGEADVVEERPVVSGVEVADIYETMTNDEAVVARQTVHELKLSKDELANDLLPEVRQGPADGGGGSRGTGGAHCPSFGDPQRAAWRAVGGLGGRACVVRLRSSAASVVPRGHLITLPSWLSTPTGVWCWACSATCRLAWTVWLMQPCSRLG
jgi:hypothetical protein